MPAYVCRRCHRPAVKRGLCEGHLKTPEYIPKQRPGFNTRHRKDIQRFEPIHSKRWTAFSKQYLRRNPLCVRCKVMGRHIAAGVVDHIIPARKLHERDPELLYDERYLQPLCSWQTNPHGKSCHSTKSMHERRGKYFDYRSDPPRCIMFKD